MSYDLLDLFKVTEVELIYKAGKDVQHKLVINEAETAYQVLRATWDMNKIDLVEQFKIILLNHDLSCLGISEISTGGISKCLVDPKMVFATALKSRATAIILAHNHPSGNLAPSAADINLTGKLVDGGKLLDISGRSSYLVPAWLLFQGKCRPDTFVTSWALPMAQAFHSYCTGINHMAGIRFNP